LKFILFETIKECGTTAFLGVGLGMLRKIPHMKCSFLKMELLAGEQEV
jgi:hypothetical protein